MNEQIGKHANTPSVLGAIDVVFVCTKNNQYAFI